MHSSSIFPRFPRNDIQVLQLPSRTTSHSLEQYPALIPIQTAVLARANHSMQIATTGGFPFCDLAFDLTLDLPDNERRRIVPFLTHISFSDRRLGYKHIWSGSSSLAARTRYNWISRSRVSSRTIHLDLSQCSNNFVPFAQCEWHWNKLLASCG